MQQRRGRRGRGAGYRREAARLPSLRGVRVDWRRSRRRGGETQRRRTRTSLRRWYHCVRMQLKRRALRGNVGIALNRRKGRRASGSETPRRGVAGGRGRCV